MKAWILDIRILCKDKAHALTILDKLKTIEKDLNLIAPVSYASEPSMWDYTISDDTKSIP